MCDVVLEKEPGKRKAHVLLNVIRYMFCCSQWSKDARQTVQDNKTVRTKCLLRQRTAECV